MLKAYIIEALLAIGLLGLIGCGLVKLYYFFKRETDFDHAENLRARRDAEDALHDLERAEERARQRGKRRSN